MKKTKHEREVQKLLSTVNRTFSDNPLEAMLLRLDIMNKVGGDMPYLEKVRIAKTEENRYQGAVYIDAGIAGEEQGVVRFEYSSFIPFERLDDYVRRAGVKGLEEKKQLVTAQIKVKLTRESGEPIRGRLYRELAEYILGAVPHAIIYLEEQINRGGKKEGTFQIPRSCDSD